MTWADRNQVAVYLLEALKGLQSFSTPEASAIREQIAAALEIVLDQNR